MPDYKLITILGPTAVGKTAVAANLALQLNGEIISADSRQVYRGMSIGTGKDLSDYTINGVAVPYHLIDIVDAGYKYNVFEYQHDFNTAYNDIRFRNRTPILCGGTGMYVEAVVNGYRLEEVPPNMELRDELEVKADDELEEILKSLKTVHNKTDFDTRKRAIRAIEIEMYYKEHPRKSVDYPSISCCHIGIAVDVEERRRRITQRLHQRLQEGMVDEVRTLLNSGLSSDDLCYYGLEYKFITLYLTGELEYNEMVEKLNVAIHQFAKRQMTWFRGMERKGATIHWVDGLLPMAEKLEQIKTILG